MSEKTVQLNEGEITIPCRPENGMIEYTQERPVFSAGSM